MHLAIGDEKAVAIVDGHAIDPAKMSIDAVLNEGGVVGFSVEDEDRSDFLIGHVHQPLESMAMPYGPATAREKS
jgi:hypothetical protein